MADDKENGDGRQYPFQELNVFIFNKSFITVQTFTIMKTFLSIY